jgi:hypothetical protein
MSIDHISWNTNLERSTDIRILEFADQVYLYERRDITRPVDGRVPELPATTFVQGVADCSSIESVKLGMFDDVVAFDPTLGSKPGADYVPMMISDKGLEVIRLEGHPFSHHKVLEKLAQSGDLVRKGGFSFIDLFQKGFTAKNLLFASVKDHSIVDLTGTPIVVPSRFSYLEGLSSEHYDLDRVLEIVAEDPEVEIHHDQFGKAKHVIPNYGDPDEPTRYGVTLTWRPTSESWGKLLAAAADRGEEAKFVSFRSYDLLKTHDVLGLDAGGCRVDFEETSGLTF